MIFLLKVLLQVSLLFTAQCMDSNQLLAQAYKNKYRRVDFKRHHDVHDRSITIRNEMFLSKMKYEVMQKMDIEDKFEPTPNVNLLVKDSETGFWESLADFVTKLI